MRQFSGLNSFKDRLEEEGFPEATTYSVVGTTIPLRPLLLAGLATAKGITQKSWTVVILCDRVRDFGAWEDSLNSLIDDIPGLLNAKITALPHLSHWGRERYSSGDDRRLARLRTFARLASREGLTFVLATVAGLAQLTAGPSRFKQWSFSVAEGAELDPDSLRARLLGSSYEEVNTVLDPGTFSMRGGIFDVFSPQSSNPYRFEFFGNEIRAIRIFSIEDQLSKGLTQSAVIIPAREFNFDQQHKVRDLQNFYDYLISIELGHSDIGSLIKAFELGYAPAALEVVAPALHAAEADATSFLQKGDLIVAAGGVNLKLDGLTTFLAECHEFYSTDRREKKLTIDPNRCFSSAPTLAHKLGNFPNLEWGESFSESNKKTFIFQNSDDPLATFPPLKVETSLAAIQELLRQVVDSDATALLISANEDRQSKLKFLLSERGLQTHQVATFFSTLLNGSFERGQVYSTVGDLATRVWLSDERVMLIPDHEFLGTQKKLSSVPAAARLKAAISSFRELKLGSTIVHRDHGIGRYCGISHLEVGGSPGDFLILEYKGGDRLYLPVDRLGLLHSYSPSGDQEEGQLDQLRGQGWEKRKSRARKAIRDMADELLKLEARRKLVEGTAFSPPDELYFAFENDFPFEETEDQLRAISEVNSDLSSARPMDRLVCGDVGFGKTEVALRAAMRAVADGYQVMVLVPTTILCFQHYRTFHERMHKYGIKVGQANRFVSAAKMRETIADFETAKVDVLVGTHRILSTDVKPRRIGLIIIDEEQRFGVSHKEKLKLLKVNCDVLTMTATPIPRTLHMSLLGLKDISVIMTPPNNRQPIRTYVAPYSDTIVVDAIRHEISRGGQVFIIHNRIESMLSFSQEIRKLIPDIAVEVAHGQMTEHQLEKIVVDFIEQRFPVLICTTIIESGIDMPNVNTMIVNRAEHFGLSQLYQLRGRIGRSGRQAYAYLLTGAPSSISDEARQRLDAILSFQELGSGFKIAKHDLELRGTGSLLGGEQSGFINEIGLECYTDMLEETIAELKGEEHLVPLDTEIKLPVEAFIPSEFIATEALRLNLYRTIFSATSQSVISELRKNAIDRFGSLPLEFERIFLVARLKRVLAEIRAATLVYRKDRKTEIKFGPLQAKQISVLSAFASTYPDELTLTPDFKLVLNTSRIPQDQLEHQDNLLHALLELLSKLEFTLEAAQK